MNAIITIFKKETKAYFTSPGIYIIAFLVAVMFSWTYPLQLNMFTQLLSNYVMQQGMQQNQLNIHYGLFMRQLSYLNLMLIFAVPAFTMKLFSEEKKMRTLDLLLTSPLTSTEIVLGKFFSALMPVLAMTILAMSYPMVSVTFASFNWSLLLIAFFSIFLVGSVYVAMDLFASSLTENMLVSYVLSLILNVSIWFVGMGVEAVDSASARQFFEHISLNAHLANLVEGTIRSPGIVFIFSLISLFVFLTERVLEASRWR